MCCRPAQAAGSSSTLSALTKPIPTPCRLLEVDLSAPAPRRRTAAAAQQQQQQPLGYWPDESGACLISQPLQIPTLASAGMTPEQVLQLAQQAKQQQQQQQQQQEQEWLLPDCSYDVAGLLAAAAAQQQAAAGEHSRMGGSSKLELELAPPAGGRAAATVAGEGQDLLLLQPPAPGSPAL